MSELLYVSWSALKEWEACRQRSYQMREGHRAAYVDGRNFLQGTLGDRAMRRFLEQEEGTHERGQMERYIDDLWDEHAVNSTEYKIRWRGNPLEDQARVRGIAKRAVRNLEPFLFERVLPHEFQPEMRFKVAARLADVHGEIRTIMLVGGIDIAVRIKRRSGQWVTGEEVWLYDLKVTEDPKYVYGPILGQLIFYGVAWRALERAGQILSHAQEVNAAYLTPACEVQWVPLRVTDEDVEKMWSRIARYCDARWRDAPDDSACVNAEGKPTPEDECFRCAVKHVCPRWAAPVVASEGGPRRASLNEAAALRSRTLGRT